MSRGAACTINLFRKDAIMMKINFSNAVFFETCLLNLRLDLSRKILRRI
jgi:hypothetical protein